VEYRVDGLFEMGSHVGVVAPPESGKSLIIANVGACVATGRDFHGRKTKAGLVVYLLGEGFRGMRRRLDALNRRYDLRLFDGAPLLLSKCAASLLDPAEEKKVKTALEAAAEKHGKPLALLIVDTLSRFITPGDESGAPDMGAYFQVVDRLRGDATAITLHHPGHDGTRAPGSSSWRAALDTEYTLAKQADVVTVTCTKMKDGDTPQPFSFRIEQAPTGMRDAMGFPVQSVVLVPTDVVPVPSKLTGKNQRTLVTVLAEYKKETGRDLISGADFRELAAQAGVVSKRFAEAIPTLERARIAQPTVGGWLIDV
jgi:hypothetical protein